MGAQTLKSESLKFTGMKATDVGHCYVGYDSRRIPAGSNEVTESLVHRFKGLDLYHEAEGELVEGSLGIIRSQ